MQNPQYSENQKKFFEFVKQYNIQEIFSDMLHTLSHKMDQNPYIFMIQHLCQFVEKEELEQNGIKLDFIEEKKQQWNLNLLIQFPNFDSSIKSDLKTSLTQQNFLDYKDIISSQKNNIRNLIKAGLENQQKYQNLYALDQESYLIYKLLYKQKIDQMKQNIDQNIILQFRENNFQDYLENCPQILKYELKIKRNINNQKFNLSINNEKERKLICLNLIDKMKSILDEKNEFQSFSDYFLVFEKNGQDQSQRMQKLIKKQGIRYQNWPENRYLCMNQKNNVLILLNKEDHLEIISEGNEIKNLVKEMDELDKMLKNLEQNDYFAWNKELGFLTTKPKYLGLGCKMKFQISVDEEKQQKFLKNLEKNDLQKIFKVIKIDKIIFEIKFQAGLEILNLKELKQSIGYFLKYSLIDVTDMEEKIKQKKQRIEYDKTIQPNQPKNDQFASINNWIQNVNQIQDEKSLASQNKNKESLEIQNLNNQNSQYNSQWNEISKHQFVEDKNLYQVFQKEFQNSYLNSEFNNQSYEFNKIVASMDSEFILQNPDIITEAAIVIRRNFKEFNFKPQMKTEEAIKLQKYFEKILKILPDGTIYNKNQDIYNEKAKQILNRFNLPIEFEFNSSQQKNSSSNKFGNSLYESYDDKTFVFINYQDHITIIRRITSINLSQSIHSLISLLSQINNDIGKFQKSSQLGYWTLNPKHLGSGGSLIYILNEFGFQDFQENQIKNNDQFREKEEKSMEEENVVEDKEKIEKEKQQINQNLYQFSEFLEQSKMKIQDSQNQVQMEQEQDLENQLQKRNEYQKKNENERLSINMNQINSKNINLYCQFLNAKQREIKDQIFRKEFLENQEQNFPFEIDFYETNDTFSVLDCFQNPKINKYDLQAISAEQYEIYHPLYLNYLKLINNQSELISPEQQLQNWKIMKKSNNFKKPKFRVEFGRNFVDVPFNQLLGVNEKQALVNNISSELISKGYQRHQDISHASMFLRPLEFHSNTNEHYFFIDTQKRIAIWLFTLDHIRIVSKANNEKFSEIIPQINELFNIIQKSVQHQFAFKKDIGFLSEKGNYLLSNYRIHLFSSIAKEKMQDLGNLVNEIGFQMEIKGVEKDGKSDRIAIFSREDVPRTIQQEQIKFEELFLKFNGI